MKKITSEERIENVELAGFSAWFKMLCDENRGRRFGTADTMVPHDTALHFVWQDLSDRCTEKCTRALSDDEWSAFLADVAGRIPAASVISLGTHMAAVKTDALWLFADRLSVGVKLTLVNRHSLLGDVHEKISGLSAADALDVLSECIEQDPLLRDCVEPYRASLQSGAGLPLRA